MFLPLDLLSEYRIQHGAIGPLYVTSSYSTWVFCRGVSGFATDCPCGVWCRGLTNCLLYVRPLLEIDFEQQLGCSFDKMDCKSSYFCILTYAIVYVLIHHMLFWLYLYVLNSLLFLSSTPVLTVSIDVVIILFIGISNTGDVNENGFEMPWVEALGDYSFCIVKWYRRFAENKKNRSAPASKLNLPLATIRLH